MSIHTKFKHSPDQELQLVSCMYMNGGVKVMSACVIIALYACHIHVYWRWYLGILGEKEMASQYTA